MLCTPKNSRKDFCCSSRRFSILYCLVTALNARLHFSSSRTHSIINEILNKKKSQPVHISNIVHNGKQFDTKIDIANQLNKFFTNIGPTLAKKCGKTQRSYKDWMKNTCSSQLNFSQISPFKVLDELYGLNCSKAVGHDGLPISYLVKAADFIYQPLTHIFNTSIASSIFPDEMKIASNYSPKWR